MPNSRKSSKKHVGAFLEPSEIEGLKIVAELNGTDLTGLLKKLARKEEINYTAQEKGEDGK